MLITPRGKKKKNNIPNLCSLSSFKQLSTRAWGESGQNSPPGLCVGLGQGLQPHHLLRGSAPRWLPGSIVRVPHVQLVRCQEHGSPGSHRSETLSSAFAGAALLLLSQGQLLPSFSRLSSMPSLPSRPPVRAQPLTPTPRGGFFLKKTPKPVGNRASKQLCEA